MVPERSADMSIEGSCDDSLQFCRADIKARRSPLFKDETHDWTFESIMQSMQAPNVETLKDLKSRKYRELNAHWDSKWGCNQNYSMNLTIQGEQDHEQRNLFNQCMKNLTSAINIEQNQKINRAMRLNKYKFAADYRFSPELMYYITSIYKYIKVLNYWNSESEARKDTQSRALATVTFNPITYRHFKMQIMTSTEILRFHEARLPFCASNVMFNMYRHYKPITSLKKFFDHYTSEERANCWLSSVHVKTFDGVYVKMPLTTCYSVVSKDCRSEQPTFVIMLKKVQKHQKNDLVRLFRMNLSNFQKKNFYI